MAEKDITEKSFIKLNDVFADVFNGLVFKGEQIVTPESLEVLDVSSQYRADDLSLHEMERDVLKMWKSYGINLVALGVENQSEADKDMPFRIIGYDGSVYRSQLLKTEVKIVNGGHKPVLSKKRYPVITIVLYFNDKKGWDYPKNIKSCFNPPLPDNDVMNRLDAFIKLMSTLTGDGDYEKLIGKINKDDKEDITVCKVLQGAISEGMEKGHKLGLKEGLKGEASAVITIIEDFAKNNGTSVEDAMVMLNVSEDQYNKYKSVLEENYG